MRTVLTGLFVFGVTVSVAAQGLNDQRVSALQKKDISALLKFYSADAVLMPEFHPMVSGKQSIKAYYENVLSNVTFSQYKRTMNDSKQTGEYVIETGAFTGKLTVADQPAMDYTGNYLIVWKANKKHELKIVYEMWGSDKSITRTNGQLPADKQVVRKQQTPKTTADAEILNAITERTQEIEQAVKKRDGLALSKLYVRDAIYIPYYSAMMIGADKIKSYYVKHEDPNVAIDSIHIQLMDIVPVKNIVVATTVYGVRWRAGDASGIVTGKNLNIWRREKDGKYYLFRQMANHD